ncbi:hypothetical protein DUI87_19020 [Hirundo rustica rustica]|uniref:Reverse transcriptase domain-containing protein n=1 Tax=Hirundo rustica rustica TaxID=333673 RepID=A0A3M0JVI0_HIRRU|nr:hypothetical protein DUI87_19020 [Hirundo rustica rustica]
MEFLILEAISIHMDDMKVIRSSQHGFTKRKSCLTNLIAFSDETTTWMNEGRAVDIVYLNFSKAFRTVSHNILTERIIKKTDQALLSGAKQKDERQWAETDTQEVPPEHEEELYCAGD